MECLVDSLNNLSDNDFSAIVNQVKGLSKYSEKKRNDLINKIRCLPANQISSACHLFQIMVYSRREQEGVIISPYLQNKAMEFLNSGLYQKESFIQEMKSKIKELEKENLHLNKDKANLNSRIHSLSMQVIQARNAKRKQISKICSSIQKAKQIQPNQFNRAVKKLFKAKKREYTAEFVKLATNISNM